MARTTTVSADDAASAEGQSGFKPWPAGEYIGQIIDIKASPTGYAKSGAHADTAKYPAVNITFKFTESGTGKGVGKKFIAWQVPDFEHFASGSPAFLFYQFQKALGVKFPKAGEGGEVTLIDFNDPDEKGEVLGQEVGIRLIIEPGDEAKGYKDKNKVSGFFDASKGVVESKVVADEGDAESDNFEL